ncbi:AzlD domain-containing protein [Lactobacillus salivarius]|uniref:AzlD domain-containing protein n=1 Tax=Ligilactobacillus salivarius TaxID=1624 RepID=UPI0013708FA8|nr:AzlD domain-containing protein [Ligilactobacillus salivarius]MYU60786.1 AzlD domain-containing protein [Ligilactobacillus salivarius]
MSSFNYVLFTIIGCGFAMWLSKVLPFILLKKFSLPAIVIEYLNFVPIVIMSALWFSQLFTQHLGRLPGINYENLLASLPTLISTIISKNLLITVIVGIISLALIRMVI